jgi:hypothetical protein
MAEEIKSETQGDMSRVGASTASENAAPKNKDVEIRIKMADNGVIVEGCYRGSGPYYEEEWVFQTTEAAFAEIPSIMSVVQTKGQEKAAQARKNHGGGSECGMIDD